MEDNTILNEAGLDKMTKAELRSFVQKILDKEIQKQDDKIKKVQMTKDEVRKIVKDMMISQYKFFWEKKSFWANSI